MVYNIIEKGKNAFTNNDYKGERIKMKKAMKNIFNVATAIFAVVFCFTTSAFAKASEPGISYSAHVQDLGWQVSAADGATVGTTGQSKRVEALTVKLTNAPEGASVAYQVHVQDYGWISPASKDGAIAGTVGQSKRIEAIAINLSGMPGYSVEYRVHVQGIGWMAWAKDGGITGTTGKSLRLEAIEIRIVKSVSAIIIPPIAVITVNSITVTGAGDAEEVKNDGILQMSADVVPENATNQAIVWTVASGTGTADITTSGLLSATEAGTVTVTATNIDSGVTGTEVITVAEPESTAPTGVEGIAATIIVDESAVKLGSSFGKITGVDASMEYKAKSSEVWTAIPEGTTEITGLVVGTYEVRYAAKLDSQAGDTIDIVVKANIEYNITGGVAGYSILVVGIDLTITRKDGSDSEFYSQADEFDNSGSGSDLPVNKTYYFNDILSENPEDTATISFSYSYRE
jgi:uncharacterized protein YjdB